MPSNVQSVIQRVNMENRASLTPLRPETAREWIIASTLPNIRLPVNYSIYYCYYSIYYYKLLHNDSKEFEEKIRSRVTCSLEPVMTR